MFRAFVKGRPHGYRDQVNISAIVQRNRRSEAKDASGALTTVARSAKGPVLAAGAAAAGLAGGIALGSHLGTRRKGLSGLVARRPKVLGVPLGRKTGLERTVEMLGKAAHELGSATREVSSATDEILQVREQLDQANRRSPIEVVLDGLTHRRAAHKNES